MDLIAELSATTALETSGIADEIQQAYARLASRIRQSSVDHNSIEADRMLLYNHLRAAARPNGRELSPAFLLRLGASDLVGEGGVLSVREALESYAADPPASSAKLWALQRRTGVMFAMLPTLRRFLAVEQGLQTEFPRGKCGLRLSFVGHTEPLTLEALEVAAKEWRRALHAFQRVSGALEDMPVVRYDHGSLVVTLLAGVGMVNVIGAVVSWSLEQYERVLNIQKLRAELRASGGIDPNLDAMLEAKVREMEERIVGEVMGRMGKEFVGVSDPEVVVATRSAVAYVLVFVGNGGRIGFIGNLPESEARIATNMEQAIQASERLRIPASPRARLEARADSPQAEPPDTNGEPAKKP